MRARIEAGAETKAVTFGAMREEAGLTRARRGPVLALQTALEDSRRSSSAATLRRMRQRASRPPSPWLLLSLVVITLAFSAGCAHDEEDARADLDAGTMLDGALSAADLRFKGVGVQPRARIQDEFDFQLSSYGVNDFWQIGPVGLGVLPFGFHEQVGDASVGSSPTGDAGASTLPDSYVGELSTAVFKPLYPVAPSRFRRSSGAERGFDSHLTEVEREGMVVSAVDLWLGTYALLAIGEPGTSTRYRPISTFVPRATLPDWLIHAGEAGQVVTAISGKGDQIFVGASTREGDGRRFEAKVSEAGFNDLVERAQSLADEGYIITAFGRDGGALLLVGTRAAGQREKREIVSMSFEGARERLLHEAGFAVVAWIRPGSTPEGSRGLVILER
jgi:hypothetical protein